MSGFIKKLRTLQSPASGGIAKAVDTGGDNSRPVDTTRCAVTPIDQIVDFDLLGCIALVVSMQMDSCRTLVLCAATH